jgi:hypothetical protein
LSPAVLQSCAVKFDGWIGVRLGLWVVLMGIWPSGRLNWGSGAFMIRDPLTRSLVYAPVWRSKISFYDWHKAFI